MTCFVKGSVADPANAGLENPTDEELRSFSKTRRASLPLNSTQFDAAYLKSIRERLLAIKALEKEQLAA
jgi:hypothetical protein